MLDETKETVECLESLSNWNDTETMRPPHQDTTSTYQDTTSH